MYDHYFQKLSKMKSDRQAKLQKPGYIESPKDVEWHVRNEKKYDTAKNAYILNSQQAYMKAKECIDLRYDYLNPVMDTFAKNMTRFFKNASNAFTGLVNVHEKIAKGEELIKTRIAEAKAEEIRKAQEKLQREKETEERIIREKLEKEREMREKVRQEILEQERKEMETVRKQRSYYEPEEEHYRPRGPPAK